jgi:hypothetical protein
MTGVRRVVQTAAHGIMGVVGLVFGVLSAVALAVAALVPAALGLLAFILSPLRGLIDRVRGGAGRR